MIQTAAEEFNRSVTENGAVGYRTTGEALLDLNFAVSSLRDRSPEEVLRRFAKAFFDDKPLATKWLFFAADVRGGMGERRLFDICMQFLAHAEPELTTKLIPLIPEYTRWDRVINLLDTPVADAALAHIKAQLEKDLANVGSGKKISLLAKWLPSPNATSAGARAAAKTVMRALGMTAKQYRQTLSGLRKALDVTEVKMSGNAWSKIDYSAVPSKANLIYAKAFMRHDEARRKKFLEDLKQGKTKINAAVLYPHDIVHKYMGGWTLGAYDVALEQLWKALPDYVDGDSTTLCVADGSGSMGTCVGGTQVTALDVANALAIYFAERCGGQFKDTYITFSEHPQIVSFAKCKSLHGKIGKALAHDEIANTNIEAVFDLILTTAVKYNMPQREMPTNILILSDMEFDYCTSGNNGKFDKPLFDVIRDKYAAHGYKLPRLVFWNICGRTDTIPLVRNELGVALVSGFSPTSVKMVLSAELDPFKCLTEQLSAPRYDPVGAVFDAEHA